MKSIKTIFFIAAAILFVASVYNITDRSPTHKPAITVSVWEGLVPSTNTVQDELVAVQTQVKYIKLFETVLIVFTFCLLGYLIVKDKLVDRSDGLSPSRFSKLE